MGISGWVIKGPVGAEIRLPEVAIHLEEQEKKGEEDAGKEGRGEQVGKEQEEEQAAEVAVVLDSGMWSVRTPCVRNKSAYLSPERR